MDRIISPSTSVVNGLQPHPSHEHSASSKQGSTSDDKSLQSKLYNETLASKNKQVSFSAFAFLFYEMVGQQRESSQTVAEIEAKLAALGYKIGLRLIELLNFRDSIPSRVTQSENADSVASSITSMKKRPLKILEILQYVHSNLWKYLFGKPSDDLVKSSERDNEYMIVDNEPLWTQFISGTSVQCETFTGGIIEGLLDHAGFPCHVTVHTDPEGRFDRRTVYLIRFDKQVLEREALRF
ncbi:HFL176Wp [Eremothecium sinecaudum]|uniref:Trafficking protein particle complex subunit n=1 Tax=Eremothecium sinecaudum TaxID=45286 RepID=A0A0X8HUK2_9SACH|nr:HFL176Wp [Eremothecium sinecaudum]AMD21680.1 HFL176Wp [Eremothecium sinecaudum]